MRNKLPPLGKVPPDFFNRNIYPKLGYPDPSILVGPRNGVDFGVLDLGDRVLVVSTDPFFIADGLGMEKAAWFAVHIVASDVAVSGIAPRYLAIDMNLPPSISEKDLNLLWDTVHRECGKLKISVITGHTARYAGCNYPMVGGATVFGLGRKEDLVNPRALPGDAVIVTKGPAIEAAGLLSAYFPEPLEARYGKHFRRRARDIFYRMSTVKDAAVAASVGGLTAMHDATECGVWGGLFEIARHSEVGMRIELDRIIMPEPVKLICECFGIDPYSSISEGTLLATASKDKAAAIVAALSREGIPSSIVGEVTPSSEGMRIIDGKKSRALKHPVVDPFWGKFAEYLKKK
ncbi:MAG: AIR synthase family protein [Candidatus Omnitrophica bacterium]|jgi:hydrogenase maturation factor|nr:AIR synthase family protein [Candidatus Omnitrophota bacterium]MDD3275138.1 AIR synthase family protein [Candidatus Omnitrophota bacterium]MDD5077922.1 AIR synthase family protein [Candidatus Omnitrophota bacterium]MDD5725022.1 AIR synthase family protein [Candidatus Omnitrophota bacterium]